MRFDSVRLGECWTAPSSAACGRQQSLKGKQRLISRIAFRVGEDPSAPTGPFSLCSRCSSPSSAHTAFCGRRTAASACRTGAARTAPPRPAALPLKGNGDRHDSPGDCHRRKRGDPGLALSVHAGFCRLRYSSSSAPLLHMKCPGVLFRRSGCTTEQSCAFSGTVITRLRCFSQCGSGGGKAESSERVQGCSGCANSSPNGRRR